MDDVWPSFPDIHIFGVLYAFNLPFTFNAMAKEIFIFTKLIRISFLKNLIDTISVYAGFLVLTISDYSIGFMAFK